MPPINSIQKVFRPFFLSLLETWLSDQEQLQIIGAQVTELN